MTSAAVLWYENYNLNDIVTPVDADNFHELLLETGYCTEKTNYLIQGFKHGFSLEFQGNRLVKRYAPNLKIRIGSKLEIWNKVMKEVSAGRYAGPFDTVPYEHFIQSPIGLVPKDKGTKTRLIFHLSYPRNGDSVNSGIPKDKCSVKYPDFTEAVKMCWDMGAEMNMYENSPLYMGKSDMSMAFRHVPLQVRDFCLMILKAYHPTTGRLYYFTDKCLPFGSSISCAIFQEISNGIAYVYRVKVCQTINYLDDFFFVAMLEALCDVQVRKFVQICAYIKFPVSLEKTVWGKTRMTFLGFLLDTEGRMVCIPADKVIKAMEMIDFFLCKKKVTVHQVQKLTGFLNFLGRCVTPGRAFTRRFYALMAGNPVLKPHHHVKVKSENKLDLKMWKEFLGAPQVFCRPFIDFVDEHVQQVQIYSDASGNFLLGFGGWCMEKQEWFQSHWDVAFMRKHRPSIEYLELFAVTTAVLLWIGSFNCRRLYVYCDNESVCNMLNNSSSTCKFCMILIRIITLKSLLHNVRVFGKHIRTEDNGIADSLSRFQMKKFKKLAPCIALLPEVEIPEQIWPMSKVWFC